MTREEQLEAAESALAKMQRLDMLVREESVTFTLEERTIVIAALEICAGVCMLLCGR